MGETPTEKARRALEKKRGEFRVRHNPTKDDITELDRRAEEARKKEQRLKRELKEQEQRVKEETERIIRQLINELDARRGDEARDASNYFNLARKYTDMPHASRVFQQLSEDEDKHAKWLRALADELERQLKQRK